CEFHGTASAGAAFRAPGRLIIAAARRVPQNDGPMASRSLQRRQLSRSKIELFIGCPRCLWLDVARGIPRPSGPPFTLNNAVDALMKTEFDRYREAGEPHPLFASVGLDAVPFRHEQLG